MTNKKAVPEWLNSRILNRKLSAGQTRILRALVNEPENFLLVSVKDFALTANVSPAAVTRFVRFIGYDGYAQFQQDLKKRLFQPQKLTSVYNYLDALSPEGKKLTDLIQEAENAELCQSLAAIDPATLSEAASITAGAGRIHVIGYGSSTALLRFLQYRLMRIGLDVVDMTPVSQINMLAEHCVHMNARRDVILTVSFRGVYDTVTHLLRFAKAFHIPSIAFSENPDSEISRLSTLRIPIKRAVIHEFKSLAVPMSLMNLFVMQVAAFLDPEKETIERRLVWFRKYQERNKLL